MDGGGSGGGGRIEIVCACVTVCHQLINENPSSSPASLYIPLSSTRSSVLLLHSVRVPLLFLCRFLESRERQEDRQAAAHTHGNKRRT